MSSGWRERRHPFPQKECDISTQVPPWFLDASLSPDRPCRESRSYRRSGVAGSAPRFAHHPVAHGWKDHRCQLQHAARTPSARRSASERRKSCLPARAGPWENVQFILAGSEYFILEALWMVLANDLQAVLPPMIVPGEVDRRLAADPGGAVGGFGDDAVQQRGHPKLTAHPRGVGRAVSLGCPRSAGGVSHLRTPQTAGSVASAGRLGSSSLAPRPSKSYFPFLL